MKKKPNQTQIVALIRHSFKLNNTTNSPLSEKGREFASQIGPLLKEYGFEQYFSSYLHRTAETLICALPGIKVEGRDIFFFAKNQEDQQALDEGYLRLGNKSLNEYNRDTCRDALQRHGKDMLDEALSIVSNGKNTLLGGHAVYIPCIAQGLIEHFQITPDFDIEQVVLGECHGFIITIPDEGTPSIELFQPEE